MNPAIFDKPFFEVTLPLMLTIGVSVWGIISTNNRRLDDIIKGLERIEVKLDNHDSRIAVLEEQSSLLRR